MPEIIESVQELTPQWFTEIMRSSGTLGDAAAVTEVELEPVGSGVIARAQRGRLTYSEDGAGPPSVVIKYTTDDPGSLGVARAMRMYETEVAFYRDLAPRMKASLPACYLAAHDDASGRFTLVLEDLTSKARPGDVLTLLSPDEATPVLAELVKLQAPTWDDAEIARLPWLSDNRVTIGMFEQFPLGVASFVERFREKLLPEHLELFEAIAPGGKLGTELGRPHGHPAR